ncbi:MAG: phenylacetate-CoA oxygenase subunit PaaJ [Pseudomonadota bacterium]|jgi:ring-1,2-phenylacetyl-CoA epoxidase subunit PaaD
MAAAAPVDDRITLAWAVLAGVMDPEVPVVSLVDLGIARAARVAGDGVLEVVLTLTYSGCPATEMIEQQTRAALEAAGLAPLRIVQQRAPAWTTDWISEAGRQQLRAYGIAPPGRCGAAPDVGAPLHFMPRMSRVTEPAPSCPRCDSPDTERLSAFGSTACKALYRCRACREPFEHFKPI